MNQKKDEGIITKAVKYTDTKKILKIFTLHHGLISTITKVNKKNNNILQSGNVVNINWHEKNKQLIFIECEIKYPTIAFIYNKYESIKIITSMIDLINETISEKNIHKHTLYHSIIETILEKNYIEQIIKYCKFEFNLLDDSGYGLQLNKCVVTNSKENLIYLSPKSGEAVSKIAGEPYKEKLLSYPKTLIKKTSSNLEIIETLTILRFFINKHLFAPYKKNIPSSRLQIELNLKDIK